MVELGEGIRAHECLEGSPAEIPFGRPVGADQELPANLARRRALDFDDLAERGASELLDRALGRGQHGFWAKSGHAGILDTRRNRRPSSKGAAV